VAPFRPRILTSASSIAILSITFARSRCSNSRTYFNGYCRYVYYLNAPLTLVVPVVAALLDSYSLADYLKSFLQIEYANLW